VSDRHDWLLVAPWYRWRRQEHELKLVPRATRPVLQKYDDSKLVNAFLADPQLSLAFTDDDWVYETSALTPATVPSGPLTGKLAEPAVKLSKPARFAKFLSTRTSTRKLFLDTHKRFYLVVCELHCDAPGFPRARRDDVCQAGFVVRRRYTSYPESAKGEAVSILKRIAALQIDLAKLERRPAAKRTLRRWETFPAPNANGRVKARRDELRQAIAGERKRLRRWAGVNGVRQAHSGWIASEREGVGSWEVVEEEPQTLLEQTYGLHALVPSPTEPGHDGHDAAIYFGLVPTGSSDADELGQVRYDDRHLYEIRCFVRRHKPGCPRTDEPNDCNGELFWSRPTEAYRLASHFDAIGSAHRPVTVQLPDFPALAAQTAERPVGALSPVQMQQPANSSLRFTPGLPPTGGSVGDGQICFLAIPLVTIVAWFVLNLFLPIVVFLFGLWFLLRLKFCIPPSVSIEVALDAQLNAAAGADLDVGLTASATIDLHGELKKDLADRVIGGGPSTEAQLDAFGNKPLAQLERELTRPAKGPDFTAGIVWEERVSREEVLVA
jgi:hypothetical protein